MSCKVITGLLAMWVALAVPTRAQSVDHIEISSSPAAIASFGAVAHDGWLYVIGGHVGRAHHHSRENLHRGFYRVKSDAPSQIEPLPGGVGLQGLAMVALESGLYRIGGMRATNHPEDDARLSSVRTVMRFDPEALLWTVASPLPRPRSSHDAVAMGGAVYVFGGWDHNGGEEHWLEHGYRGMLGANGLEWTEIPQPFVRRAVAVAAHEEHIWVVGGLTESGKPSRRVDIFDPASESWSRGPDLPSMGFGATAFGTPQGLFVTLLSGAVLRLADDSSAWTTIGQLTFPRFFARLLPAGVDRLAVVAGAGRIGHMSTIEWLTLDHTKAPAPATAHGELPARARRGDAEERIAHFPVDDGTATPGPFVHLTLPNPTRAKNRQIIFRDRNRLFFWGGNDSLGQHDFKRRNFVREGLCLDLATLAIETLPPLPQPLQSAVSVLEGKEEFAAGYVIGGFGHDTDGDSGAKSRDEIHTYDVVKHTWTRRGTLPAPLTQFGLVQHGDELWVFGGLDYDPTRGRKAAFAHSDRIYRAPLSREGEIRFAAIDTALPAPRRAFGAAKLDDRYFITGGMRDGFEVVETFLAFDFRTRQWHDLPAPGARISPNLVAVGKKLYLIGGSKIEDDEAVPSRDIEVFDTETSSWSTYPRKLPLSPKHLRVMELAGRLVLISTHNDSNELDLVVFRP